MARNISKNRERETPQLLPQPPLDYGLEAKSPFFSLETTLAKQPLSLKNDAAALFHFLQNHHLLEHPDGLALERFLLQHLNFSSTIAQFEKEKNNHKNVSLLPGGYQVTLEGTYHLTLTPQHHGLVASLGGIPYFLIVKVPRQKTLRLTLNQTTKTPLLFFLKILVEEGATLYLSSFGSFHHKVLSHIQITLQEQSQAYPAMGFFGYHDSVIDQNLIVYHEGKKTKSKLLIKGALANHAQAIALGDITIAKSAFFSEGFQEEDILLLSNQARAVPIPQLKISNHEVTCSHAATVRTLNPALLFYALSRGLSFPQTLRLLFTSFYSAIFSLFPHELQEQFLETILHESNHLLSFSSFKEALQKKNG